MERRYELLVQEGVRNIESYNQRVTREGSRGGLDENGEPQKPLPYIVVIIDELADLMMAGSKEVEGLIIRLAQKARAAGIHLVLATQRPDRTVLTGLIKSNLPLKICMKVISAVNSTIVLDQTGAEKLLGRGDLLCDRGKGVERAQSPYITQEELRELAG
jgi:S-DNA-T family DNA segregation ATPase FtsK/SpoIIIE